MDSVVKSFSEQISEWLRESVMIKLASIGFLVLILLIPSAWISQLMEERQERANQAVEEISGKWSGPQTLAGPVLVIPYTHTEKTDKGSGGVELRKYTRKAFFLPEQMTVSGELTPQVLHRGLFEAVVYDSKVSVQSVFGNPDFAALQIAPEDVLWKDAYMLFSLSDLRGIAAQPAIQVGGTKMDSAPVSDPGIWSRGSESASRPEPEQNRAGAIRVTLNWPDNKGFAPDANFELSLRGSQQMMFVPLGKTTDVKLKGAWADAGFDGEFLPVSRSLDDKGFEAQWKILHFNRPFSQQWTDEQYGLRGNNFGVRLLMPVEQYQKSIRTSKYGVLLVLLTFVSLFMVEIIRKFRIHPFQYTLVGAAVVIYYLLLLALSEQIGFNWAYLAAGAATSLLIVLYTTTFIRDPKVIGLIGLVLVVFYSFIFIIIQMQDYALMLGSIGLFTTIALLMFFSRKVQWYK